MFAVRRVDRGGSPHRYGGAIATRGGAMRAQRLPPFGKAVPETCTEVWVYVGPNAWHFREHCRLHPARLILPPDVEPDSFGWPVRDREALVVEAPGAAESEARILRLVAALRRNGATVVRVIHGEPPLLAVFRSEGALHAA